MTALVLGLLLGPPVAPAPAPVWRAGDRIEARVEIRSTNAAERLEMVETEAWTLDVDKVEAASATVEGAVQARLSRALTETRLDGASAGPPPGGPRVEPWTFRPDGSLAFRPRATTALEARLYRVLGALLPAPGGDPAGRAGVEFPADSAEGLPAGVYASGLRRREGPLRPVDVTYREAGLRLAGLVLIDPENGWPLFATLRISGLRLEGGEMSVETLFTLTATKAKIRGENVGLPGAKDAAKPGTSG